MLQAILFRVGDSENTRRVYAVFNFGNDRVGNELKMALREDY